MLFLQSWQLKSKTIYLLISSRKIFIPIKTGIDDVLSYLDNRTKEIKKLIHKDTELKRFLTYEGNVFNEKFEYTNDNKLWSHAPKWFKYVHAMNVNERIISRNNYETILNRFFVDMD
jgi:hypothetical protein